MTTATVTLHAYEQAERDLAHEQARIGLVVHAIVTVLVSAVLVAVNVILAPEFPWSAFAVAGMAIGLAAHWWFGFQKLDAQLIAQQEKVEERAAHLR